MKVEYEYTFQLPRKLVWKWMKNETVIRNSLTGCKSFEETADGGYHGEFELQFGPINEIVTLEVQSVQEKIPSFSRFQLKGSCTLGEIQGEIEIFLKGIQGTCEVTMSAEAEITGQLAPLTERFLNKSTTQSLDPFFQRFEREMKKAIYYSRRKES